MSMPIVRLKEIAKFVNGKAFQPTDWSEEGIPIIRIQNLNDSGKPFNHWAGSLDRQVCVASNSLLLAWSGTPGTSFGAHIWDGPSAVLNQHIFRVDLCEDVITKQWAKFAINSKLNTLIGLAHGGVGLKHVTKSMVEELEIPLPSLSEQRRIAAILNQADRLRARRREALAQLDELQQSIFIEMFGDPGNNPLMWSKRRLGELIEGKPNNGIFKKNEEYGMGLPVVWVEELFRGNTVSVSKSRRLKPTDREVEQYGLKNGDILFCRSSLKLDGIGYNNVYLGEDNDALFECHVIRISPDKAKVVPEFLNFALRMPSQRQILFKYAKTVTMSTIDQDGLLKIALPVPPLDLQVAFKLQLGAIDEIRKNHLLALSQHEGLVASLQHCAFEGNI